MCKIMQIGHLLCKVKKKTTALRLQQSAHRDACEQKLVLEKRKKKLHTSAILLYMHTKTVTKQAHI